MAPSSRNRRKQCLQILVKQLVPEDAAQASVAALPEDLLLGIFGFIHDSRPNDLLSVALSSSLFYKLARQIQARELTINLTDDQTARNRLELIARNNLTTAVHSLHIASRPRDFQRCFLPQETEVLQLVINNLKGMTGLRDIHWEPRVANWQMGGAKTPTLPKELVECLSSRTRLWTTILCDHKDESHLEARQSFTTLVSNRNLFSLSVKISFLDNGGEELCRATVQVLKEVLLSCPNLRRIPLMDIWYAQDTGVGYGPSFNTLYCGLGFASGQKPPPLEELGMGKCSYPWGKQPPGLFTREYPEERPELAYWAETFDWSQLRRLNSALPHEIVPYLTGLKELVLGLQGRVPDTFLNDIPTTLELLSVNFYSTGPEDAGSIIRHGEQLRTLRLHQSGAKWSPSNSFLVRLRDGLPVLEELSIDLFRQDNQADWPYDMLDIISGFPRLRTLELWFPLLCGEAQVLAKPAVNVFSAQKLFHHIRSRNKHLQRLRIHSNAPQLHYMSDWWAWSRENASSIVCEANGPDTDDGLFVTCPKLDHKGNTDLRRIVKSSGNTKNDVKHQKEAPLPLKIAIDGPLSVEEWRTWKDRETRRGQSSNVLQRFITHPMRRMLKA